MDPQDSAVLLKRAREGSKDALNTLLGECGERLLAFIRLRLGPGLRADVESGDILQLSLLRAFQHIDQFEGQSRQSLAAWLVAIARNMIRDQADFAHRKRRDRGLTVPLEETEGRMVVDLRTEVHRLMLKDDSKRLEKALESLDPLHREVILLRKYEELSYAEIGERLGKTPDACRMMLARAMTALANAVRTMR